jgi:hypothetical protein
MSALSRDETKAIARRLADHICTNVNAAADQIDVLGVDERIDAIKDQLDELAALSRTYVLDGVG